MAAPGTRGGWGRGEAAGVTPLNFPSTKNPIPPRYCPSLQLNSDRPIRPGLHPPIRLGTIPSFRSILAVSPLHLVPFGSAWHYPIVLIHSGRLPSLSPLHLELIRKGSGSRFSPESVSQAKVAASRIGRKLMVAIQSGIIDKAKSNCTPDWKRSYVQLLGRNSPVHFTLVCRPK